MSEYEKGKPLRFLNEYALLVSLSMRHSQCTHNFFGWVSAATACCWLPEGWWVAWPLMSELQTRRALRANNHPQKNQKETFQELLKPHLSPRKDDVHSPFLVKKKMCTLFPFVAWNPAKKIAGSICDHHVTNHYKKKCKFWSILLEIDNWSIFNNILEKVRFYF